MMSMGTELGLAFVFVVVLGGGPGSYGNAERIGWMGGGGGGIKRGWHRWWVRARIRACVRLWIYD